MMAVCVVAQFVDCRALAGKMNVAVHLIKSNQMSVVHAVVDRGVKAWFNHLVLCLRSYIVTWSQKCSIVRMTTVNLGIDELCFHQRPFLAVVTVPRLHKRGILNLADARIHGAPKPLQYSAPLVHCPGQRYVAKVPRPNPLATRTAHDDLLARQHTQRDSRLRLRRPRDADPSF